jgi:release factor glutamine methyltransferase
VNEHVLIPRPETEELVEWIVADVSPERQSKGWQLAVDKFTMLDIGTGSGCIPIAIKKKMPSTEVFGCDISIHALEVAQKNAVTHQADIGWLQMNFLDTRQWENLPMFDIIVSNPPYIPLKDQETMQPNVLLFEPHLALFVENNDPLVFYKAIARFAKEKMKPGGSIYVEIHEALGKEVMQVFSEEGFGEIELKKDMQGKERMIRVMIDD